jgi:hypothetical protein
MITFASVRPARRVGYDHRRHGYVCVASLHAEIDGVFVCLFVSCLGDLQPEGLKHVRLGVARPDDQGVGPPRIVPCEKGLPCRDGTGPPQTAGTALGHRGGLGCSIPPLPAGPNLYNAASARGRRVCLFAGVGAPVAAGALHARGPREGRQLPRLLLRRRKAVKPNPSRNPRP